MKKDFKYYGLIHLKYLDESFNSFPSGEIVIGSSRSLSELNNLFPFTNDEVKCVENIPLDSILLNKLVQLTFGDPRLTPDNVVATGVVYRKNSDGSIHPYLRVVVDDQTILYFYIWDYDPETRSGFVCARLTIPEDLAK